MERAKGRFERDRRRRERDGLAEARAMHLVESVDRGEAIGAVAERLGISVEPADRAHAWAASHPHAQLPPDTLARVGARREGGERAALVETLGGEHEFESLASELAEGLREAS